ncbi:hypothetical protein [Haliangium sp.]|uniref:hypothetical protein n=1 Tax=Haliangium sp. TaxID=2663208 RepID=UPI003D0B363E
MNQRRPKRRRGRWVFAIVAASAAVGGWLARDCTGLGTGTGLGLGERRAPVEVVQPVSGGDAGLGSDARPEPCALYVDSKGLTIDGAPGSVEDAVTACRGAGKARLRATGAARAGTYDALVQALDQAGIAVERY